MQLISLRDRQTVAEGGGWGVEGFYIGRVCGLMRSHSRIKALCDYVKYALRGVWSQTIVSGEHSVGSAFLSKES